jgi:hypothetical protein
MVTTQHRDYYLLQNAQDVNFTQLNYAMVQDTHYSEHYSMKIREIFVLHVNSKVPSIEFSK